MKRLTILLISVLLVCLCFADVQAAGTATLVDNGTKTSSGHYLYRWECTSHTDGTVDDTGGIATNVTGWVIWSRTYPDDAGDVIFTGNAQPSNAFNVECRASATTDAGAQTFSLYTDILYDLMASCSNAAPTQGLPVDSTNGGPVYLNGQSLNVYASSAGSTKKFLAFADGGARNDRRRPRL